MEKIGHATFVSPSRFAVEKNKEKKIMATAKLVVLHLNAINEAHLSHQFISTC